MKGNVGLLLAAALLVAASASAAGRPGPTLRLASTDDVDTLDPALAWTDASWTLLRASCTTLMDLPGREPGGRQVVIPGGAAAYPRISADGRTYTFTIRRGMRFSDGTPIRAANYARALGRLRDPAMRSPIAFFAEDVQAVHASGMTLRVRLRRPRGDLTSRAALPFTCPVPLGLPVDPVGIDLPVGSGPYTVAGRTRNREIVLRPNRFYRGPYPRRFSTIVFTVTGTPESTVRDTDAGRFDYSFSGLGAIPADDAAALVARYGVGRGRLFYTGQPAIAYVAFNLRRGMLSRDLALRRAVNLALDRPELIRQGELFSANRTDQMLPFVTPGFRKASLFPLAGANVGAARRLAGDRLKGKKLVLYSRNNPAALKQSAVIAYNLSQLGADVEVKAFATPVLRARLAAPGEPWDLTGMIYWVADDPDPSDFLGPLFGDPPGPGSNNVSGFADRRWVTRLRRADRLSGSARYRALGDLDVELMRTYAPVAPVAAPSEVRIVSPRLGCVRFDAMGGFDLRTACLRE